jgi:hypothetical protein
MKYRQGTFYKQNKVIYETRASKGIRFITRLESLDRLGEGSDEKSQKQFTRDKMKRDLIWKRQRNIKH